MSRLMDADAVGLLAVGFELAAQRLALVRGQGESREALSTWAQASAARLVRSVLEAAGPVSTGPDAARLEALHVAARELSSLVRTMRFDGAKQYAPRLREWLDATRARVSSAEELWLGPWLAGKAVVLAALTQVDAGTPEELATFEEEVEQARTRVLDLMKPELLSAPSVPWRDVAAFVKGEETHLLRWLVEQRATQPHEEAGHEAVAVGRWASTLEKVQAQAEAHLTGTLALFVAPQIPEKKLRGAREGLLKSVPESEPVVALLDTTVFGGGGDGLAFLADRFFFKELGHQPTWMPYSNVAKARSEGPSVIVETLLALESGELAPDIRFGGVLRMTLVTADGAARIARFLEALKPSRA
ncbi:hypothetical protein ACLESO_19685 [Pyxidicoccus sp. 3LG]